MLMAWVEQGQSADGQMVSGGEPARERPLCAYPTYVTWNTSHQNWGCTQ